MSRSRDGVLVVHPHAAKHTVCKCGTYVGSVPLVERSSLPADQDRPTSLLFPGFHRRFRSNPPNLRRIKPRTGPIVTAA